MKKKFMKIIAMALTLASLFTFAAPAFADRGEIVDGWAENEIVNNEDDEILAQWELMSNEERLSFIDSKPESIQKNELDLVLEMKNEPTMELRRRGLNESEISEIKEFDLDTFIVEQQSKSIDELERDGLTEDRIQALFEYDGTINSARATFSTMNIYPSISAPQYDSYNRQTTASAYLFWSWSSQPYYNMTDIVAIGVTEPFFYDNAKNSYSSVTYTATYDSRFRSSLNYGISIDNMGRLASSKFSVSSSVLNNYGVRLPANATSGSFCFYLRAASNFTGSYAMEAGYGHSTLGVSPSVTFTASGLSPSLKFGNYVSETKQVLVYHGR